MQDKIKRAMPLIISGIMVVFIFLVEFVTMRGNEHIDVNNFAVNLLVNSTIIVSIAIAWMTSGTDRAKRDESLPYSVNLNKYSALISAINTNGNLQKLKEFCNKINNDAKQRKINAMLNAACIDRAEYEEKYKLLTKKELKAAGLARNQIAVIGCVQQGNVIIKETNAQELMTNSKTKEEYGIHYDERSDKSVRLLVRVVKSMVTATMLSLIVVELSNNITNLTAWIMFLMKLLTVVYTAWSAEREGFEQIADTKNKVILRRIMFLNLFNEWTNKPGGE